MLSRQFYKVINYTRPLLLNTTVLNGKSVAQSHTIRVKRTFPIVFREDGSLPKYDEKQDIYYIDSIKNGPKTLAVILTKDSEEFGVEGEMVVLPKHFGRHLIKNHQAVYASPENIEEYSAKQKKSSQTLSGRRILLWLKKHDTFVCPYRYNATWTVTPENLARCFLREYNLSVLPSAITLPEQSITNENVDPTEIYEIQITVNKTDSVPVKISIPDWNIS